MLKGSPTDRFDFDQSESGDYGHLTSGDGTHQWLFGVYPSVQGFVMASSGENQPHLDYLDFPDDSVIPAWLPAVVADPTDPASFFFLAGHLWRYPHVDDWWSQEKWSTKDFEETNGEYRESPS